MCHLWAMFSQLSRLLYQLRRVAPMSLFSTGTGFFFLCVCTRIALIMHPLTVSMVTPCLPSVHTLIPPISVVRNLVLIAYSILSAGRQTSSHHRPVHTNLSGSICVNLKSVASCHHDSLRLFPSPWLLCACVRVYACVYGSVSGGHISRVSRGWVALPHACCLFDGRTSVGCDMKLGSVFLSPSFLLLLFRLCYEFPSCSTPSLHLKTLSHTTCAVLIHNLSAK